LNINKIKIQLNKFKYHNITKKYISWINDPDLMRFSRHKNKNFNKFEAKKYLASFNKSENIFLTIKDSRSKKIIGTITAYIKKENNLNIANLGVLIGDKNYRNKNFGTITIKKTINFLSKKKNIQKIIIGTKYNNKSMIKIAKKNLMVKSKKTNSKIIYFEKKL
jgi:ribosomal-protein-alanine N-acetyltransferase